MDILCFQFFRRFNIIMDDNLFFFEVGKDNYYLFNACQHRVTKIPFSMYKILENNSFSKDVLSKNQKSFYEKITDTSRNEIVKTDSPYVGITLANSNICNLNCSYCHRNKQNHEQLNKKEIENILDFVITVYAPESEGYVIDFDLQGEPLRNYENLELFKKLKEKYTKILSEKNKWIFFSFITNGTCITESVAKKIKEIGIIKQTVSIDGPDYIHDFSRKYSDGKGSHEDVIKGIKELQKHNVKVHASCVLTAKYPRLFEILEYFLQIGVDSVHFQLVRAPAPNCFDEVSLNILLKDIEKVYDKLYEDIANDDLSLLLLLKDSLICSPIRNILLNTKFITRCNWQKRIVIDTKGDIYPCLGLIGKEKFCYGNISNNSKSIKLEIKNTVDKQNGCKKCWARYLCGGYCHLISYNENMDENAIPLIECKFRKELIKNSLVLFSRLMEKDLLDNIILPLCKDDLCAIINK